MPFQGNINAGAFDPSLLSLLFSERDKRRQAERQSMLDQAKMQQDAMKLQMEQAAAERKEQREIELHRESVLKSRLENEATLQSLRGVIEETAAAVPESIRRQSQGDYLASKAPGNAVLTANLTGTEDSMRALNQLGMTDPQAVVAQGQQATSEIDRASTLTGDPATDKLLDFLEETTGLSRADLRLSGAVERNRASIAEGVKTDAKVEKAERLAEIEFRKQDRLNAAQYKRSVRLVVDKADNLMAEIDKAKEEARRLPLGSPRRAALLKKANVNQGQLNRMINENVDPGHFANIQKFIDDNVNLMQEAEALVQDLSAFKSLAESNPNFLGATRGGLTQLLANVSEGTSDILGVANVPFSEAIDSINRAATRMLVNDPSMTPDQRDLYGKEMGIGLDGTLQARSDAKAISSRIAFVITRLQNPGRFADAQYQENRRLFGIDKGTAADSLRRLNSAIAEITGAHERTQQRLSAYHQLAPGVFGGLTDQATGETVIPGAAPTPYESTNKSVAVDPNAIDQNQGRAPSAAVPVQPAARGNRTSADGFLNLSPEEKRAHVERLMRERQSR